MSRLARGFGAVVIVAVVITLAACRSSKSGHGTPSVTAHAAARVSASAAPAIGTPTATATPSATSSPTPTATPRPVATPLPTVALGPSEPGSMLASLSPLSFSAISPDDYWVLGSASCTVGKCAEIVRTTDGGESFERIHAPALAVWGGFSPTLTFANQLDGYIQADSVYETHDGGASWQKSSLPGVNEIEVGSNYAYAILPTGKTCSGCPQLEFERSPLLHDAWTVRPLPPAIGGLPFDPESMAVNGQEVWLLGEEGGLLHSADSGQTFTTVTSPCQPPFPGRLSPTVGSALWADCPTGMASYLTRSTDGGGTWQPVKANWEQIAGDFLPNFATPQVSPNGNVVVYADAFTFRSTDGGTSWSKLILPGYGTHKVVYITGGDGLALVQNGEFSLFPLALWQTSDGETWSQVKLP